MKGTIVSELKCSRRGREGIQEWTVIFIFPVFICTFQDVVWHQMTETGNFARLLIQRITLKQRVLRGHFDPSQV